jgi:ribonuclease III
LPDLTDFEQRIGYSFERRELLTRALTHKSYSHEAKGDAMRDNETFEFLGDSVLGFVIGDTLFQRFPELDEGALSKMKAYLVSATSLAAKARLYGMGEVILLGVGEEKSGGRRKDSLLANLFEALIAAVYLDSGFEAASAMVNRLLAQRIETVEFKGFYDFKTRLQETSQARMKATPTYEVVQELGPDHDKRFVVAVKIGADEWARAVGKSKKEAEQMAAAEAHFKIEGSDVGIRPKR